MEPCQIQLDRVKVELEVMAMKEYSTISKAPGLEPRHQLI